MPSSLRSVFVVLALAMLGVFGSAAAQGLPANAQEALDRGEAAMQEALTTYEAHYPDRPLWQTAFREGRTATTLAPGHPAPLRFLAEAYSRSNWHGPAMDTWYAFVDAGGELDDEARELVSVSGNAVAYAAYQQGDKERAADLYGNVLDYVPDDLEAHRWLGRVLLELRRPEQAVAAWRTLTELAPDDAAAAYFLEVAQAQSRWGIEAADAFYQGINYYESGDLTRARLRFAEATARNEGYTAAWAWLGRIAYEQEHYEDAASAYGRAVQLEPANETYDWFLRDSERLAGEG
ncbi:MAG: tetratricopeptide repeat protein [Trueperaceae bacterium]